jgi:hypothetical protein
VALHERVGGAPDPLAVHELREEGLEATGADAAAGVRVVVAGDDGGRHRGGPERALHEVELGLEREVGEIAGHHHAVDAEPRDHLHHALEQRRVVRAPALERQVHATREALVEVAPRGHPGEIQQMDVRGMQDAKRHREGAPGAFVAGPAPGHSFTAGLPLTLQNCDTCAGAGKP